MPIRRHVAAPRAAASQIAPLKAAQVFEFTNPDNGNLGLCIRVKDSKVGKNRFLNLESGKLLTSVAGDTARPIPAGSTLVVS